MKLHRQAQVVYKTQSHLVWVTRYRRTILVRGIADYLKHAIWEVREFHPDWMIEEMGVEPDHVHRHMIMPPKYAVSKVVDVLKSVTSRQVRMKFPRFLEKVYWDGGGIWARGFFASTVGINEAVIRQYVRYQGTQETGQAQLEL